MTPHSGTRLERTTRKVIVRDEAPPPSPAPPRPSGRNHTVYALPAFRPPRP